MELRGAATPIDPPRRLRALHAQSMLRAYFGALWSPRWPSRSTRHRVEFRIPGLSRPSQLQLGDVARRVPLPDPCLVAQIVAYTAASPAQRLRRQVHVFLVVRASAGIGSATQSRTTSATPSSPPSCPVTRSVRRPPTVSTAVLAVLRRLSRAALPLPHVRYATSAASSPQGRIGRSGSDAQSRAGTHVCMGMYLRIRSPDHARAWASQEQHTRQDIAEHLHVMHSCDVAAMPLLCTVALAALGDAVRKLSCSSAARIVLTR